MSRHRGRRRRAADALAPTKRAAPQPRVLASVLQALPAALGWGRLDALRPPSPPFSPSRLPTGQVLVVGRNAELAANLARLGFDVAHLRTTFRWQGETGVPAVVLLDFRDPDHALAALEQIRAVSAQVPVVALAGASDQWLALDEDAGVTLLRASASTEAIASVLCDVAGPAPPRTREIDLRERIEPVATAPPPSTVTLTEVEEPAAMMAARPEGYREPSIFDEPAYRDLIGRRSELDDDTGWFFESGPAGR